MTRHKNMPNQSGVTPSSGNVFADLKIKNPDVYMVKSVLAIHIHNVIQKRRLTQEEAGRILGISQPKVSAILKGRLDGFSVERLLRLLNALGCDVNISISQAHPQVLGHVRVA